MTAQLVYNALSMAIRNQKPTQGLIVHTDRGSQYCGHTYRNTLEEYGFQGSMRKSVTALTIHQLKISGAYSKMN